MPLCRKLLPAAVFVSLTLSACTWEIQPNKAIELAPEARLASVATPPQEGRAAITRSADGRVAYLMATPKSADREPVHAFAEYGGKAYEVVGIPYEGKPLENLHWEGTMLVVDRWYHPEQGIRVYISMDTMAVFYTMAISRDPPPPPSPRPAGGSNP